MNRVDPSKTATKEFRRLALNESGTVDNVVAMPVLRNTSDEPALSAYLGLAAFEAGNFVDAIDYLLQVDSHDANGWKCRFYLAMSYLHENRISCCLKEFNYIVEWCPDPFIRCRAEAARRNIFNSSSSSFS